MRYQFEYIVDNKPYKVNVEKKLVKNINYRLKDGEFYISASPLVSKSYLIKGLDKYAKKMLEREVMKTPVTDDYVYILGIRYSIKDVRKITLETGLTIEFDNKEQLELKLKSYFKELVTERVRIYERIMNVPAYKVKVQKMRSRYGSNTKQSHSLNFSTILIHYSINIIDAIVVHELAHYYVFNHSKAFYNVVYKYCPNYKYLHKCLRKGVYHD